MSLHTQKLTHTNLRYSVKEGSGDIIDAIFVPNNPEAESDVVDAIFIPDGSENTADIIDAIFVPNNPEVESDVIDAIFVPDGSETSNSKKFNSLKAQAQAFKKNN